MELVWQGLVGNFYRLTHVLLSAGSSFSLGSLGFALIVAIGVLAVPRWHKGRRVRPRVLVRALLPRRIWRSPSTVADFGYFLFNTFLYAVIFGMAAVSYQFLTNGVVQGLVALFGPPTPSSWPELVSRSCITVMLFLAYEFGYWLDHYLKHRVPALWELHKVHHTAEVLTPLTAFRVHPLDSWTFGQILAVVAALTNGVAAYLFGDASHQYVLSGNNVILVVFIYAYVHLQHSHLWISFRGVLGRLFISPAHHQVHHSTNPAHFNKNLGSCLAIWDWLFGTLYVPARRREKLAFGVEPAQPGVHTVTGEFIAPFGRAFVALFALVPRRRRPLVAAESEHR